jgi:hypothetical protein
MHRMCFTGDANVLTVQVCIGPDSKTPFSGLCPSPHKGSVVRNAGDIGPISITAPKALQPAQTPPEENGTWVVETSRCFPSVLCVRNGEQLGVRIAFINSPMYLPTLFQIAPPWLEHLPQASTSWQCFSAAVIFHFVSLVLPVAVPMRQYVGTSKVVHCCGVVCGETLRRLSVCACATQHRGSII